MEENDIKPLPFYLKLVQMPFCIVSHGEDKLSFKILSVANLLAL